MLLQLVLIRQSEDSVILTVLALDRRLVQFWRDMSLIYRVDKLTRATG